MYFLSLDAATKRLTGNVRRPYNHSSLKLSGTLKTASHVAAPNVPVALWQQAPDGGAFTEVAHTTTDATGSWRLAAAPSSSRVLRVVAGIKAEAKSVTSSMSSSVTVRETVTPGLSLRVTTSRGGRIVFTGKLAIAPLGRPRPLMFIQTPGPDGWEEVGSPIRVAANGDFRYVYRGSAVTFGRTFKFRAATPAQPCGNRHKAPSTRPSSTNATHLDPPSLRPDSSGATKRLDHSLKAPRQMHIPSYSGRWSSVDAAPRRRLTVHAVHGCATHQ